MSKPPAVKNGWIAGAKDMADRLIRLPGVCGALPGPHSSIDFIPADPPYCLLTDGRLAIKHRYGNAIQLIFVTLSTGPEAEPLRDDPSTILQFNGRPPLDTNTSTQDEEVTMTVRPTNLADDGGDWIAGAQELSKAIENIPGVNWVDGEPPCEVANHQPGPPSLRESSGELQIVLSAPTRRQILCVTLESRSHFSPVKSAITRLLQQSDHANQAPDNSFTEQGSPLPINHDRVVMYVTPIEGAYAIAKQLGQLQSVDRVCLGQVRSNRDDRIHQPEIRQSAGRVVVTIHSQTHKQDLEVTPTSPDLLNEMEVQVYDSIFPGLNPAGIQKQERVRRTPTVPNPESPPKPATPPATQGGPSVLLTQQQSETYEYVLSLGPAEAPEFPVASVTSRLSEKYGKIAGTSRYASMVTKGLIQRHGHELVVVRQRYAVSPSQPSPLPRPPVAPPPAAIKTLPLHPTRQPVARPETQTPVDSHLQFFIEQAEAISDAEAIVQEAEEHRQALRRLGWEVVKIEGQPYLRRLRKEN